jgi:uncharacterized protein YjbI with pentapeptide repeats
MPNKEHLRILKQGVEVWNRWRAEVPDVRPCLNGADLRGQDFSIQDPVALDHPHAGEFVRNLHRQRDYAASDLGVDFHGVELNGARLNNANLFRANLAGAKLHRTKLTEATLRKADLMESDLSQAVVEKADLRKAHLYRASLQGANLRNANFEGADFTEADLTEAELLWANLQNVTATDSILIRADLSYANLTKSLFWGANLRDANLTRSQLVFTILDEADIIGCKVFGVSAWGVHLRETNQSNLVVTREDQPKITVDDLEIAQFTYLLLNRSKLRNVIDTITSKAVLILGRFTPERKTVLDAMADELRKYNLLPIIFDFERSTSKDFTETIKTLAGMSLFVIVDITNPKSAPLELQATVPDYQIPFVPIIQEGEQPFSMFRDLGGKYDWVLKPVVSYPSSGKLLQVFKKAIIERAWEKRQELEKRKLEEVEVLSVEEFLKDDSSHKDN